MVSFLSQTSRICGSLRLLFRLLHRSLRIEGVLQSDSHSIVSNHPNISLVRDQVTAKTQHDGPPPGSLGVCVETGSVVAPQFYAREAPNVHDFSQEVARGYNKMLPAIPYSPHPAMHSAIHQSYMGNPFAEWSLDSGSTIVMPNAGRARLGLENISRIFRAYPESAWRNHFTVM